VKDYLTDKEAGERYRERQRDNKVIPPPTCKELLKSFHDRAKYLTTSGDKLKLLKELAQCVVDPIAWSVLAKRRRNFDSKKNKKFPLNDTKCWVCDGYTEVRHHVIMLKNGGPPTAKNNIVYLCNSCHCDIHPWAAINKPLFATDHKLAHVKNEVVTLFEKAAKGRCNSIEEAEVKLIDYFRSVFNTLVK
jgi:hypothetical protein